MLWALLSNGCTCHVLYRLLYCCVQALPSNGLCLQSHLLAAGLYATICNNVYVYWPINNKGLKCTELSGIGFWTQTLNTAFETFHS
jgi:hypothetical protein